MTDSIKCPVCGGKTALRTAKKDGAKFHVCVNYPDCKGKAAFDDEWGEDREDERPATEATHTKKDIKQHTKSQRPVASSQTINTGSPLMVAVGDNGQLELYDDKVRIKRKGFTAFVLQGLKGEKDIYISQISSVQFKSSGFTTGYIQFAFLGGQETKAGMWNAMSDENTVTFNQKQENRFKVIRDMVNKRIVTRYDAKSSTNIGDLEKLAELRNKGIITNEEFDIKKRQILGI